MRQFATGHGKNDNVVVGEIGYGERGHVLGDCRRDAAARANAGQHLAGRGNRVVTVTRRRANNRALIAVARPSEQRAISNRRKRKIPTRRTRRSRRARNHGGWLGPAFRRPSVDKRPRQIRHLRRGLISSRSFVDLGRKAPQPTAASRLPLQLNLEFRLRVLRVLSGLNVRRTLGLGNPQRRADHRAAAQPVDQRQRMQQRRARSSRRRTRGRRRRGPRTARRRAARRSAMLVGIGVPSKYFTLPVVSSASAARSR